MTDDPLAGLRLSAEALGCDLLVVPVPDPEAQMDAIRRRHGEGRHKPLRAMIAETLADRREG
jgi:hypothetical protein